MKNITDYSLYPEWRLKMIADSIGEMMWVTPIIILTPFVVAGIYFLLT